MHDYQKLNLEVVKSILVERLDDFLEFTWVLLAQQTGSMSPPANPAI